MHFVKPVQTFGQKIPRAQYKFSQHILEGITHSAYVVIQYTSESIFS